MNKKIVWYSGVILLGLLVAACNSGILPGKTPDPPTAVFSPPNVPHSIEGRADCLICHEKGVAGAPQYPSTHIGRPSDVCLTCHQPPPGSIVGDAHITATTPPVQNEKGTQQVTPPESTGTTTAISAKDLYAGKCAACHGINRQGTPGFAPDLTPESLAARTDAELTNAINNGISGTAMPPFKNSLTSEEIDALLQFLRSPP